MNKPAISDVFFKKSLQIFSSCHILLPIFLNSFQKNVNKIKNLSTNCLIPNPKIPAFHLPLFSDVHCSFFFHSWAREIRLKITNKHSAWIYRFLFTFSLFYIFEIKKKQKAQKEKARILLNFNWCAVLCTNKLIKKEQKK